MRKRAVVIGSSNTDLVVRCGRLPAPGETVRGGAYGEFAGGKGANQAVALARAGFSVTFVGRRGGDRFGRAARTVLAIESIDVKHFRETPGIASGVALVMVGGGNRENLIAVARSANDMLSEADVIAAESAIRSADVVLAQLEVPLPAVEAAARLAVKYGVPFVLNPAPARRLPARLLRFVHTITPNEAEAAKIVKGGPDGLKACRMNVIITLGAKGALVRDSAREFRIPAPRVTVVDTVGAGDCFSAWVAAGIAEGMPIRDNVERAVRAAAIAVTREGAIAGMPRRSEVAPA